MRDLRLEQNSIPFPVAPHLPHYFDIKLIVSMSLELAIEYFNNAKLSFYWKMISQDTLGCKWLQANLGWCKWWEWSSLAYIPEMPCWRFASVMAGRRGSDTFIRTTWSLSLLESSLHWLHLRQALPSSGPGQRPLAFVLPSHYPVKRASLSHKSSRCDFDSVVLSPVNLPKSVTVAREIWLWLCYVPSLELRCSSSPLGTT